MASIRPPFSCLHFLLFLVSFSIVADSPNGSKTDLPLLLVCNSDGGVDLYGRHWTSDSKYLASASLQGEVYSSEPKDNPPFESTLPKTTARVFTSPTNYTFPVLLDTQYILRLHFNPSPYGPYNVTQSNFTVVAGSITLLKNFNPSITAKAHSQPFLVYEYMLAPLVSGVLNVSFLPSNVSNHAFINGIELIAMEEDIFTDKVDFVGLEYLAVHLDVRKANMQTLFRLNVGGNDIPPTKDSGLLYRNWYRDTPFLSGFNMGMTSEATTRIQYGNLSHALAPAEVYRTARLQGVYSQVNQYTNLTWVFELFESDDLFYVIRLHFCDFLRDGTGQRLFEIVINNRTAEPAADIFGWANSKATPVIKDYVVNAKEVISVSLMPLLSLNKKYQNVLLNGIEVFKLADKMSGLAGSSPMLPEDPNNGSSTDEKKTGSKGKFNFGLLLGGVAGGAAVLILGAICFFKCRRKTDSTGRPIARRRMLREIPEHTSPYLQYVGRRFSLAQLQKATMKFDESSVIRAGPYGKVYKGTIGRLKVTVERADSSCARALYEFRNELGKLSKLRHRNVVSLLGFCDEGNELMLVFEYVEGRTILRELLYGAESADDYALTWKERLHICVGIARGIQYLHTGGDSPIVHRNINSSTIVVDNDLTPKLTEFGLAKSIAEGDNTVIQGDFLYVDPEYVLTKELTVMSDIYSFGVLLYEILCAKPPFDANFPKGQRYLKDRARTAIRGDLTIVDPKLEGQIRTSSFTLFGKTAEKCSQKCGKERPTIDEVTQNLEYLLEIEEISGGSRSASAGEVSASRTSEEGNESGILQRFRKILSLKSYVWK